QMVTDLHALPYRAQAMGRDEHAFGREILGEAGIEVVIAAEADIEVHGNPGASPAFFQLERHPDAFLYHARLGRADVAHSVTFWNPNLGRPSPCSTSTAGGTHEFRRATTPTPRKTPIRTTHDS